MNNQAIKEQFYELAEIDQEKILEELMQEKELKGPVHERAENELKKIRLKKPCPYCKSVDINKRGRQRGAQMYACKSCKKWYSETTGTPLYKIHLREKWQSYMKCMEAGMPIKKIAKELGISIQTSFNWRHKILTALSQFEPVELSGEIECDELELAVNEKGSHTLSREARKRGSDANRNKSNDANPTVVQVVTAVSRTDKSTFFRVVESKRIKADDVDEAIGEKLENGGTLITDKHSAYRSFAKKRSNISHKTLRASDRVDKKYKSIHLQNVNNTHSRLRQFLSPFNGVSSKYLQNHLNWFAYAGKMSLHKELFKHWFITILMSDTGYALFIAFKQNAVNIRT